MALPVPCPANGERTRALCLWGVFAASCLAIAIPLVRNFSGYGIWDDALLYPRYADNLLHTGRLSWNPGAEPTYGLTSPLFLLVVLPLRLLTPHSPLLTAVLSSAVCGVAFLGLLAILLLRGVDATAPARRFLLVLVFFVLGVRGREIAYHFETGMDTTFALCYVTGLILLAKSEERAPSFAKACCLGLLGGLAFLARPDLLVYSALVPLSMLLFARERQARRDAVVAGLMVVLTLAALMACAQAYFGSPLPLPFYVKTLKGYADEAVLERYRFRPTYQLALYAESFWMLFALIGAGIFVRLRWRPGGASPVDRGLLAATAAHIVYHVGFVLPVMGHHWRFFLPTLPALAFLAAQAGAAIGRRVTSAAPVDAGRIPKAFCWLAALLAIYALSLEPHRALAAIGRAAVGEGDLGQFSALLEYNRNWRAGWAGLAEFSTLPDDLVIATTELGRPAALNPRKIIVDLSGLTEPTFARRGFSARQLFLRYRPDVLYLPHPHYNRMCADILADPCFRDQYEHFPASVLSARMGRRVILDVALRRDSRHYPALRQILADLSPIAE